MNHHRTRFDLVKPTVSVALHSLVIPVWIELPIVYYARSSASFGPPGQNEPSYPGEEEEEPYPSCNPGDDGPDVAGIGRIWAGNRGRCGRRGVLGRVDGCCVDEAAAICRAEPRRSGFRGK